MLRPCSHNIIPATAPSPVTVTRDIGLQPTQHRLSMIPPCLCVALVSLILSFFSSVAFSSNITLDGRPCRFVSKLRRLLSRDDLKNRRGSRATARTAWTASLSLFLSFSILFFLFPWRSTRTTCKRPAIHFSTSYCPLIWGYYFLNLLILSTKALTTTTSHRPFFFCLILVFILPSVSLFFSGFLGKRHYSEEFFGTYWQHPYIGGYIFSILVTSFDCIYIFCQCI